MLKTNRLRLQKYIEQFSQYGGTEKNGVTRLALSEEDIVARQAFIGICKANNLSISIDDLGNIYATLNGRKNDKSIYIGSHLDSVVKGGRFDGVLGVLTALEVVQTIIENKIDLEHSLTIVNFTNEEGARFEPSLMCSGILNGRFNKEKMFESTDINGKTFGEALAESGFDGDVNNRLTTGHAYVELHIEQGPVLEAYQKEIGVVQGVLGMVCYNIRIEGESNHAGTTPISMRKDSMFVAANIMVKLQQQLKSLPKDLVYTIGRINASPNIHTVIPNSVVFSLEARHQDPSVIQAVEDIIHQLPTELDGCHISSEKLWDRDTVKFEEHVYEAIAVSADELGYSNHRMYSGAGHDAQFIAKLMPSAMIFVPSVKGYSHREDELTSYEDCSKGADVLLHTVLKLDKYE